MPITCVHALCAILPLIATPIEPQKQIGSNSKFTNPTPWKDAQCRPANYVTHDPIGLYEGRNVSMDVIERVPGIEWEKKLFCESIRESKEGYFSYPDLASK